MFNKCLLVLLFIGVILNSEAQVCTNCGIGELSPVAKLEIKGCGNTENSLTFQTKNSNGETSVSISDGQTINLHNSNVIFENGIGLNLISQYLDLYEFYDANNGDDHFITIKTNIPFKEGTMMSSLKIKYWSFRDNYELNIGWYVNTSNTGTLNFYSPSAFFTGVASERMKFQDVFLSEESGKVNISIPHGYFYAWGNLMVESNVPANSLPKDWHLGWEINENSPPNAGGLEVVCIKKSIGSENISSEDLLFNSTRFHDLDGNSLNFLNGNIGIGLDVPLAQLHVGGDGIRSNTFSIGRTDDLFNDAPWYGLGRYSLTNLSKNDSKKAVQLAGYGGVQVISGLGGMKIHYNGDVFFESSKPENYGSYSTLKYNLLGDPLGISIDANKTNNSNDHEKYIALNSLGGNVGIGKIPTSEKLEVNGSVLISETLRLGSMDSPPTSPEIGEMYLHKDAISNEHTLRIWLGEWKDVLTQ